VHIKREERSQINNLKLYLKLLEKQEQAKPKTSRRREIIKGPKLVKQRPKTKYIKSMKQKAGSLKK
jgi:hypothetical protein